jgi:hypothetical protein
VLGRGQGRKRADFTLAFQPFAGTLHARAKLLLQVLHVSADTHLERIKANTQVQVGLSTRCRPIKQLATERVHAATQGSHELSLVLQAMCQQTSAARQRVLTAESTEVALNRRLHVLG